MRRADTTATDETASPASHGALQWALLAAGIVLLLLTGGYLHFVDETEQTYATQAREIEAIGALKVEQVVQWREERLSDARRSSADPLLRRALEAWFRSPRRPSDGAELRETLRLVRDAYDYHDVLLLDPDGGVLLAAGDGPVSVGPETSKAVELAPLGEVPAFSDVFRDPAGQLLLDTVAPITGTGGSLLGVLVLRSDPNRSLYPLIQSWPAPSQSAEILIVERDGDEALVLNPLRHRPGAALSLRFPLQSTDRAADPGVLGEHDVVRAPDYRGIEVLSVMDPIPNSDWNLVAKVDAGEILSEVRYHAFAVIAFTACGVLVAVLAVAFAYRRRQADLYRDLYQSEREQRDAQGRFRTLLYSIGDAVITTDPEGLVLQVNPVAEQLTGWTEVDARGRPLEEVFQIVDERTRTPHENPVRRVLLEGNVVGLANDTVLIARDGVNRPIAESGAPIRDGTGAVIGVVLVFRDQTAERTAQRNLQKREEGYRLLFENNPHPMWVYDLETLAFLEVNDAALVHYGFSRLEFLAMKIPAIHPAQDVARLLDAAEAASQRKPGGGGNIDVWRHHRKDGSLIDVETTSTVLDLGGRRAELVLANDITEIKRATDALRTSEERFRFIVENEPECVKTTSLDGTILDMNRAGLQLVEADHLDQVLDRSVLDLVHPEDRDDFLQMHLAAIRGEVQSLDFRVVGRKGTVRWVATRSAPLRDGSGNVVSILSVTRDITDRREAEEKLRQSAALMRIAGSAARLGGWVADLNEKRVIWSDEVCAIHQVPPGTSPSIEEAMSYYAPEWREVVAQSMATCVLRGSPLDFEAELLTSTGRRIWVRVLGHAEGGSEGQRSRIEGAIQDISDRKHAETEARRTADRLTATLESVTDSIVMLDRDWRFTYCNPDAERLMRRTRDDLVGETIWEAFPETVGTVFESEYRRAVAEQQSVDFEAFFPPLETWFEIRAYPSEEGLAIYFRDINERRRAEEKRNEDEERLLRQRSALITLTGRDAFDSHDLPSALRRITEAAARTLGVARVSIWRFDADHTAIHSEDQFDVGPERHSDGAELTQADYPAYFRALLEEDVVAADDAHLDPRTCEFSEGYLRPQGITSMLDAPIRLRGELDGVICHEHIGPPRVWTSDEKTFAVAAANLVSLTLEQWERKRAEETLRHRVAIEGLIARTSVRFLSIAPGEIDTAIDEALEAIGCIAGADRSYVFQLDETRGTTTNTHGWCAPGVERHTTAGLAQDAIPWWMSKLRNFESIYLHDPSELPPEASVERKLLIDMEIQSLLVAPIFWRNELRGFLGFETVYAPRGWSPEDRQALETLANTIALALERAEAGATQERLEAQLLQSQKLEAVGRLAGGVAHDFNNMLTIILGHADMALERLDVSDPKRADLEQIIAVGHRSADLTRQLLAFARQQTVAPRVLDLNETIASMLKILSRLIGEDIELVWRPGSAVRSVKIDPAQLDQILANLAVNARDAISGVGRIIIETDVAELDDAYCEGLALSPGPYNVLTFSDTGCGMDKETVARAFEPFFTTKPIGAGTGLGLATAYGILKQNYGHINAYSELGKGTTFRIYLPSHGAEETKLMSAQPTSIATGTETILLVEDEAALLKLVAMQLRQLGYNVLTAGLPREALEVAERHPDQIHLLMTDVIMPEMNGRELLDRLSSIRPGMKSLFISGYTADIVGHQGVLDEGISFLQKPFTRGALATKIREALSAT